MPRGANPGPSGARPAGQGAQRARRWGLEARCIVGPASCGRARVRGPALWARACAAGSAWGRCRAWPRGRVRALAARCVRLETARLGPAAGRVCGKRPAHYTWDHVAVVATWTGGPYSTRGRFWSVMRWNPGTLFHVGGESAFERTGERATQRRIGLGAKAHASRNDAAQLRTRGAKAVAPHRRSGQTSRRGRHAAAHAIPSNAHQPNHLLMQRNLPYVSSRR